MRHGLQAYFKYLLAAHNAEAVGVILDAVHRFIYVPEIFSEPCIKIGFVFFRQRVTAQVRQMCGIFGSSESADTLVTAESTTCHPTAALRNSRKIY